MSENEYDTPEELKYTEGDEWVRVEGDRATVGVTDYAQQQLGDVVFVETPDVGRTLTQGETFGVIESVKAVSDLYAPVAGEVVEVNGDLEDSPERVNESCYGEGWMLVIGGIDASGLDSLMDAAAYIKYCQDRADD